MKHLKVAPRDIFNEANFTKYIAAIVKGIENKELPNILMAQAYWSYSGQEFELDESSGDLLCNLFTHAITGETLSISRNLNSRDTWSAYVTNEEWEEFSIFNEDGSFCSDFTDYLSDGPAKDLQTPKGMLALHSKDISESKNEYKVADALYEHSITLKCLGKLALDCIVDTGIGFTNMKFDEESYHEDGLEVIWDGNSLILATKLFRLYDDYAQLRCRKHDECLWPLEIFSEADGDYIRVFDDNGDYSLLFQKLIDVEL